MSNELMKIGCVNHDCDKCKAQREPVQRQYPTQDLDAPLTLNGVSLYPRPSAPQDIPDLIAGAFGVSRGTAYDMMREALAEQSAQQESQRVTYYGDRIVLPENPNDPLIVIKGGMEGGV